MNGVAERHVIPIHHAHIISHTHWDREWYLNSRFTNEWLVPFFDALFAMLEKEPAYRFVLDGQTSMIEDAIEQLEQSGRDIAAFQERLRTYAAGGRLLVGPYYLQPDWQLVSDEALVRNLLIGQAMARAYGPVMQAGWLLDNFGQISQAPQIHQEFGIQGVFVWRGIEMDPNRIRSEFVWKAPDGSAVLGVYLVGSYRNGMRLAAYPDSMAARVAMEVEKLGPFATTPNVLIMNGYDQEMVPDDIMPALNSEKLNWDGVQVSQSTPEEYLRSVHATATERPTVEGTLYSGRYISVFPGILSSRMYLKTENDARQRQLEKVAEPLAAVAWALGAPYPGAVLSQCWRLLLKNHPHDSICGVSIDDVHTDMESRFGQLESLADDLASAALGQWIDRIDTTRCADASARWIVVNTAAQPRSGVVALGTPVPSDVTIRDAEGNELTSQPSMMGDLLVCVSSVGAVGYQTLYATPRNMKTAARSDATRVTCDPETGTVENAFLQLRIAPDGSLELTDKRNRVIYKSLAIFESTADAGDTYNYSPLPQDPAITSRGHAAQIEFLETGPLRVTVRITHVLPVPEGLVPDRSRRSVQTRDLVIVTWLTLLAGSAVCRFHTRIRNTAKDHRLRILFPTGLRTAVSCAQTQFDVVEHPLAPSPYDDSTIPTDVREILLGAREPEPTTIFPQRAFVDVSDGQRGLAVLNRGLPEYEVLKQDSTIALTLFRSVGWIARPDLRTRIGDAGPLIAVPDAQCLRTLDMYYALLPHADSWQTGQVAARADEFNRDLLVAPVEAHAGSLADVTSFVTLEAENDILQLTALKRSEDGGALIVRFFNPSRTTVEGHLSTFFAIRRAIYATLDEREEGAIGIEDPYTIHVIARPKEIVTLRLEIDRKAHPITAKRALIAVDSTQAAPDSDGATVAAVTEEEVRAEMARADALALVLAEKQEAVDRERVKRARRDLPSLYEFSQLQLDAETARRAYWEARLSAILLTKKLRETVAAPGGAATAASFDSTLREIGLTLNQTRISKRALEYVVDCYRRLLARANANG